MNEIPLSFLFASLFVLLLLSAFFSSTETSMMALNRYRLKHLKKKGHKGAKRASRLLKKPDRLISLILLGNNLVNFLAASIFTGIAFKLWGETVALTIGPVVLAFVFLIFAEITPKTIAAFYPEKIAFPAARILVPLLKIFYPFVWFVNKLSRVLLRIFGIDPDAPGNEHLSADELRTIVGEAGPHIPQRHQGMLLNILDLEHATVEDIMIPRNEIIGLDMEDDDEILLAQLQGLELTRFPIFKEDINNVLGIIHQRKISRVIDDNGQIDRKELQGLADQPYFIPESTPLHTQLFNFQKEKRRMGLVVDEYGVVQGLVTLEDILEEIVGEFTSNLEYQNPDIVPEANGAFIIQGSTTIRDINKTLHWELPTEGPKTINGLLLEHLEGFPDAPVSVKIGHYYFEILEIKDNIIKKIKTVAMKKEVEQED